MQKLGRAFLVLAAGSLLGLALVASASGTTATSAATFRQLQQPVAALAIDGNRVAYDLSARYDTSPHAGNKVIVWNVRTGKTVKVSGKKTAVADGSGTGSGVFQLAIAGSRVAWLENLGGNLEGDDYLFTSSVGHPKERKIAYAQRNGDGCPGRSAHNCAGPWLGGLVGSGNTIALNRWTSDSEGAVASGGLYLLTGTKLRSIATGPDTVLAASSDGGREAVLRSDGSVAVYSKSGTVLVTVNPPSAQEVALSGKNLVVLGKGKIGLYDAHTGSLLETYSLKGKGQTNLDVQGKIAVYTAGKSVRAVNLSNGKDSAVATLGNRIAFAGISSAGLVYAENGVRASFGKSTLAFMTLAKVAARVR